MGVEVMQPKMNFRRIIEEKGMPNRWRRFCCGILKEYKVLDYAVIGVRRSESRARKERYKEPEVCRVYNKKSNVKVRQYLPILEWTNDDIARFVRERGIKCHPLYYDEEGDFHPERRLGCLCCPLQSRQKRIQSFKDNPKIISYYIKAASKFLSTHPNSKIAKLFPNVYEWFVSQVFCDGERQFRDRFGATLFDNGIDCKQFLEQQFNIKL